MIDEVTARELVRQWHDGLNAVDLDLFMAPFAENVVFSSPFIPRGTGDPSCTEIVGLDALRKYIGDSFVYAGDVRYEVEGIYTGVDSIVLVYTCGVPAGRTAAVSRGVDLMRVDDAGRVVEWRCHY